VYEVRLTVTDSLGQSRLSAPVLVVVTNAEPSAVGRVEWPAGADAARVGRLLNFSAADSRDPDGGNVSVTWAFGDGNLGQGLEVQHAYRQPGSYRVTLAVEDAFGAVSVGFLEVVVLEAAASDADADPASEASGSSLPGVPGLGVGAALWAVVVGLVLVGARRFGSREQ
jgi:hypothetical protein